MGCIHSTNASWRKKYEPDTDTGGISTKAEPVEDSEILQLAELTKARSHAFTEMTCKKKQTYLCKQNTDNPGALFNECKVAVHKKCDAKQGSTNSTPKKKRGSIPRSKGAEQVMELVMERHYDFDLTYITERIISVFFLPDLEEQRYLRNLQEVASMLKSKHQDKFLLLNLSEKRHDITKLNPKVQDFGWPDLHAPPLDRICAGCKAMESWLGSDPQNVVVLHCRGDKGKTGVIVAAYMHYSKISAGVDQVLTTLAMRKFCEDQVSSSIQPSQNRYIYHFSSLLSGTIKMNSSPLLLHQILIPSLPNFQVGGGFYPFLKIYQSLNLVYTSAIYDPQSSRARKLCIFMEPALLLKGDIMVKCYHRRSRAAEREVVFRVQFHTCTVHGAQLGFDKTKLDLACTDDRFPADATVEFIFSNEPEKLKGREYVKNDTSVKVDYNTSDPVVRWDSYENFNLYHQDSLENISHTRGPLDGSLYAKVKKRRGPGSTDSAASPNGHLSRSPTVRSQRPSQPLSLPHSNVSAEQLNNTSPTKASHNNPLRKGDGEDGAREKTKERQRETAILDDGDPSNPGVLKQDHLIYNYAGTKCGDVRWDCVGQCSSIQKHPKSRTLPALPTKSVSPPPHSTHFELCHRQIAYPLPELPWERPPPPLSLPCLVRPCYPYSTPEHTHPLSHTLPATNRLCIGEECQLFHYSSQRPASHLSNNSLPSSPYREMFFSSPTPCSSCSCQACSGRQEHQLSSITTFHPMNRDKLENSQWPSGGGLQRTRGEPLWGKDNQWELVREAENCQYNSAMPAFCSCHSTLDQGSNEDHHRFITGTPQGYPSLKSVVDARDGASSGYHTPVQVRHSCPYSLYQSSQPESHESRGYTSGYHSGSASPLPASSPSPGKGRVPETPSGSGDKQHSEHHKVENVSADVDDAISLLSDGKSDSNGQSTIPAKDSDHDYTVIGPTHTEDSVIADSPPQSKEISSHLESNKDNEKAVTPIPRETYSCISTNTAQTSTESLSSGNISRRVDGSNQLQTATYATVIINPVQVQLNGSAIPRSTLSDSNREASMNPSSPSTTSPNCHIGSPDLQYPPKQSKSATDTEGQKLTPDRESSLETKPPSPVPDGYHTPTFPLASYYYPLLHVPHLPYTGYTAVTIPAVQPPLPEKKRLSTTAGSMNGHNSLLRASSASSPTHHVTFIGQQIRGSSQHNCREEADIIVNAKFVQDSSKYWYKPGISRDQAIAVLKDKEPGSFLIRDSNSFQGAYGLALKVATPPPNANIVDSRGDPLEQLVRHFLIETGPRGVKIKGCQNESYFGSLSALVYQHSITPISLPCALHIPEKDLVGELQEMQKATNTSTAGHLLKQGAACNVLYLYSVETESLTGPEAVSKATNCIMALSPRPAATVVHFKVSAQGITLTDSKRRLFFRRHYPISSVTFSSLVTQDKRWTDSSSSKMFGFVARRTGSPTENVCHLFTEMDPEQPAVAIVNFINKVMLGPQLHR